MKPLRLAMISERFWPRVGSLETRAADLACELADRGNEVTVVTARWRAEWPAEIFYHGVPVVRLAPPPSGRWTAWRWSRALERWLKRNADHFDAALVWGLLREAEASMAALASRVPVVLVPERTGWQGDCFRQARLARGGRTQRACRQAAALVSTHPAVRRELEAAGYPRQRIRDVPAGVRLLPQRTEATRADARESLADASTLLQLSPHAPLVACTTRLAGGRGWQHLLAAWSIVARHKPAARLWLAGESPQEEDVLHHIDGLGLAASAIIVGKFDDVAPLLAAADLLVAPSPEGSPQGILESMAAGLPAVAADVPINRWLLGENACGLLAAAEDAEALAGGIMRLLDDAELAQRLGACGRQRARQEFAFAAMAGGFCAVLDSVRTKS